MITNVININNNTILNFFSSLWYTINNSSKYTLDITKKVNWVYLPISQI